MNIHSLLNPLGDNDDDHSRSELSTARSMLRSVEPCDTVRKRQRIPKDAPVFLEGNKTVGILNYPPHEAGDDEKLAAEHRKFHIYPMGEILRKGVRHIPYNSEKKDFLEKTGREAFEMFQYTYKVPGNDKEYVVVWDYNVGLVRMTPFFKSLKYTKTVPAKALRENVGLKDVSYSITGGALVCQGYWMPYQAAKAIAATFCYNIRWALTPVFGNDFPSLCIHPKDPSYTKFLIDPEIVRGCIEETDRFRTGGESYKVAPPHRSSTTFDTPRVQFGYPPWGFKDVEHGRPRTSEEESGYCTASPHSDTCLFSPEVSPRSTTWTVLNRSQSPASPSAFQSPSLSNSGRFLPAIHQVLPTSVPDGYYDESLRNKRTYSKVTLCEHDNHEESGRPQTAVESAGFFSDSGVTDCGDGVHTQKELDAAGIMLQLSAADKALLTTKRTRRGTTFWL